MLDKMSIMKENVRAILKGFDRSDIAVMRGRQEARIKSGSVFDKAKDLPLKFRRIEQINRVALNRAFFIAALPAKYSGQKSAAGKNRRVKHSQRAAGGRGAKSQIAPDAIDIGLYRQFNGLSSRAEGSTVNRPYRAKSENARTGNVTG